MRIKRADLGWFIKKRHPEGASQEAEMNQINYGLIIPGLAVLAGALILAAFVTGATFSPRQ